ncbi:MAG: hypothetical protein JXB33_05195 [Clostridia bacterium]|nr:hypothetical protein [Clostridia bacterium]
MKRKLFAIAAVVLLCLAFQAVAMAQLSGGSTPGAAPTVYTGATHIYYNGTVTYFKFVAPDTGKYAMYSSSISADSYGYLYDSMGFQITFDDDAGEGLNFRIENNLISGSTYYIGVRNYSGTNTNTCYLNIEEIPNNTLGISLEASGLSILYGDDDVIYIIGTTTDADWNNVTVSASINGITDSAAVAGGNGMFILNWDIDVLDIADGAYSSITVSAYDGIDTSTAVYTGTLTVDRTYPVITAGNISISGASGTGGTFRSGDTVAAIWDNTSSGDNNPDISAATVDFSAFGGEAATAMSNASGIWTAAHTIANGSIDGTNLNITVTASDNAGNETITADTANSAADNQPPVIDAGSASISGASGNDGIFILGDTLIASWDNSSPGAGNEDIEWVEFDFSALGGSPGTPAVESGGVWTASIDVTPGTANGQGIGIAVTAGDDAGNTATTAVLNTADVDSMVPTVSLADNEPDNIIRQNDRIVITAVFSEPMEEAPKVSITSTEGINAFVMTGMGGGTEWIFRWIVPVLNGYVEATVSGNDAAGNPYMGSESLGYFADSTPPIVKGAEDGGVYASEVSPSFNEGAAFLNDRPFESGDVITEPGDYILRVRDTAGNIAIVNFSIARQVVSVGTGGINREIADVSIEESLKGRELVAHIDDSGIYGDPVYFSHDGELLIDIREYHGYSFLNGLFAEMSLRMLEELRERTVVIKLITEKASYYVPAGAIDTKGISARMGVESSGIMVRIGIRDTHWSRIAMADATAGREGYVIVNDPIDFEVSFRYMKKTIVVGSFIEHTTKIIQLPGSEDGYIFTSAAVLEPDGGLNFAPTVIISDDRGCRAVIENFTNSSYFIIRLGSF